MPRRIVLMCDYHADPVWSEPDGIGEDLDRLPLSPSTREALRSWAGVYDADLEWESPDAEAKFEAEGRRLWLVVRDELGDDFEVGYCSETLHRTLWDPAELRDA